MSWLVHHEFGLDHRPFRFAETHIYKSDNTDSIDYWLVQWLNAYSYLLHKFRNTDRKIYFLGYEDLCDKDGIWWKKLCELAEVPVKGDFDFIRREVDTPSPVNFDLKKKASENYAELLSVARERLSLG